MIGQDERAGTDGERRFSDRAAAVFDASVQGLDAATRSRLNRARQRALAELPGRSRLLQNWIPAVGVTAAAVLAVIAWSGRGTVPDGGQSPASADLEILLETDSLEMLEELEFYSWMELDDAGGAGANVG